LANWKLAALASAKVENRFRSGAIIINKGALPVQHKFRIV
jgi:hypothetical protein